MSTDIDINSMDDFHLHEMQPELLAQQLMDGYLSPHMGMDGMAITQDPNFIQTTSGRHDSVDTSMMTAFDEHDNLDVRRSFSYSSSSAQSQSPTIVNQYMAMEIPQLQTFSNPFTNSLEQVSPVTAALSSRRDSDDESQRAERRRAQNRAAQRAYRQRKDQSLKQRELEVETLREELDKAQRLNRTLSKVVAVLRERIKNPPTELDAS